MPRDEVTTKQRIDGEYVDKTAGRPGRHVLALQPGVVAESNGTRLSIRGGRTDEAVTYIDGVPVSPGNRGTGFVGDRRRATARTGGPSSSASRWHERLRDTTGATAAAEFGNAQSGVIRFETRGGGIAWSGNVAYETDELFGLDDRHGLQPVRGQPRRPDFRNGLTFF